jgi:hypothetical protein
VAVADALKCRTGVESVLRMRSSRLPALFALLVAEVLVQGAPAQVRAEPRSKVRLDYQRGEGGTACPDASALQVGVAARVGYDPFDDKSSERLKVSIRPLPSGLEARIEMLDRDGQLRAERRLVSRQRDCKELASSVELAISIAIDPSGSGGQAPSSAAPTAAAEPPSPNTLAEPPPVRTAPTQSLKGDVSAMVVGGFGSAPSTSVGLSLGASLRGEFLSLGVEARADVPSSTSLQVGEVASALYTASLVPCLRATYLGFCALASAGVLHGSSNGLADARQVSFFYAAIGARIALAYPLGPRWGLGLYGDAVSPLTETTLTVDNHHVVWSSPTLAFALSLGVTAKIP